MKTRRGSAVLDAPEQDYASGAGGPRRAAGALRRDLQDDYGRDFDGGFGTPGFDSDGADADFDSGDSRVRRQAGLRRGRKPRIGLPGWVPEATWARVVLGVGVLVMLGLAVAGVQAVRTALVHDERFVIPDSSAIAIEGNRHVTKAQLLSIFGGDVERNIFTVSLTERRAELERLPWVEHATVMRLLPDHLRISIAERTPVAFVRQGGHIGLVDKSGVLMDMAPGMSGEREQYSFPVVTGISAQEPLSTRMARMKIFERFTKELDSNGAKISDGLSEVDLSDPEDVKALIPDDHGEVLVHFGDSDFVDRYQKYKDHLADWKTQYPKLASVDLRYDRQAVLEMAQGSSVPVGGQGAPGAAPATPAAGDGKVRQSAPIAAHVATARPAVSVRPAVPHPAVAAAKAPSIPGSGSAAPTSNSIGSKAGTGTEAAKGQHLMVAKDVPVKKAAVQKPTKKPVAMRAVAKKAAAKKVAAKKVGRVSGGESQSPAGARR